MPPVTTPPIAKIGDQLSESWLLSMSKRTAKNVVANAPMPNAPLISLNAGNLFGAFENTRNAIHAEAPAAAMPPAKAR